MLPLVTIANAPSRTMIGDKQQAIAKLHSHGRIAKVKGSRLYRVTERGARLMAAAILCRNKEFPEQVLQPA